MQQTASKKYLMNLVDILPLHESNTARSFLEFLIAKDRISKEKRKKVIKKSEFEEYVDYMETLPFGEALSKREKKAVETARTERKNNEYFLLDDLLKLRSNKI